MPTLQQLEQPIDEAIVRGLIEVTPEWWKAAILEIVWCPEEKGMEGFEHEITSPEGHRDPVMSSDSIHENTFRLADLFRQHRKQWRKVVYTIQLQPDGNWKYNAKFIY